MKKIKTKIILYFSISSLLLTLIIGVLMGLHLRNDSIKDVERLLFYSVRDACQLINARNEINYVYLEGLASRSVMSDKYTSKEKVVFLQNEMLQNKNNSFSRLGYVDLDGNIFFTDDPIGGESIVNISEREYYQQSLKGKRGISIPLESLNPKDKNAQVVMYSVPVFENEKVTGAVVAVADGWFLNELTDGMGIGEKGYAYIIDKNGTTIAHPNRSHVSTGFNPLTTAESDENYQDLAATIYQALNKPIGISSYLYEGENIITGHKKIENTDWVVLVTALESEVLSMLTIYGKGFFIYLFIIVVMIFMISIKLNSEIEARNKEINNQRKQLEKEANFDELTGIFNRRAGVRELREMMANSSKKAEKLTIIFIDIDKLKVVNDKFGHSIGDDLISSTAGVIYENIPQNALVFRLGGDEMVIAFYQDKDEATESLAEILTVIEKYNNRADVKYEISFSYGICQYKEQYHKTVWQFIDCADKEMYQNKKKKRDKS